MLGKYERLDILGHGASGIVYLAQDTLLRKRVALKEINAQGDELQRVLEEARVLDRLRHPNIVAVNGVDTINGKVVIDMEYVQGSNLLEILRQSDGPLPLEDCLNIAIQICDGLAYAHDQRTIHRDIKPANILVSEHGEVKLADFGLAQVLGTNSYAGGAGTFAYMAPEDFQEGGRSDRQSDLWAVGVILYEMLTARRPFNVSNPRDPFAWSRAVAKDIIEPPSLYRTGLPHQVDQICLKALQRDRAVRYDNASDMASDLRKCSSEGVVTAASAIQPAARQAVTVEPSPSDVPTFLGATDIDSLLAAAPGRWAEFCAALTDGSLQNWLNRVGEPLLAQAAGSLEDGEEDTIDYRLRDFLYRAGMDLENTARTAARLGGELIGSKRYPEAVDVLQSAVNLDPSHPSYHRLLAQAARGAGDMELTREVLQKALLRHPNDRSLKKDLAVIGGGAPQLSKDSVDFGVLHHGENRTRQITLHQTGADTIRGRIVAAPGWVTVTPLVFNTTVKQVFNLQADSSLLPEERTAYRDNIVIETTGGSVDFPVSLDVLMVRPEFGSIALWYLPVLAFCLLPWVFGEAATALSVQHGRDDSLSPAGLIASGILFSSFLATNVIVDTRVNERIAAGLGIVLLPMGIYQLIYLFAHAPGTLTATWQVTIAAALISLVVPTLQAVALVRSPEILSKWQIWCTAIIITSSMISFVFWHSIQRI